MIKRGQMRPMKIRRYAFLLVLVLLFASILSSSVAADDTADKIKFYEKLRDHSINSIENLKKGTSEAANGDVKSAFNEFKEAVGPIGIFINSIRDAVFPPRGAEMGNDGVFIVRSLFFIFLFAIFYPLSQRVEQFGSNKNARTIVVLLISLMAAILVPAAFIQNLIRLYGVVVIAVITFPLAVIGVRYSFNNEKNIGSRGLVSILSGLLLRVAGSALGTFTDPSMAGSAATWGDWIATICGWILIVYGLVYCWLLGGIGLSTEEAIERAGKSKGKLGKTKAFLGLNKEEGSGTKKKKLRRLGQLSSRQNKDVTFLVDEVDSLKERFDSALSTAKVLVKGMGDADASKRPSAGRVTSVSNEFADISSELRRLVNTTRSRLTTAVGSIASLADGDEELKAIVNKETGVYVAEDKVAKSLNKAGKHVKTVGEKIGQISSGNPDNATYVEEAKKAIANSEKMFERATSELTDLLALEKQVMVEIDAAKK